MTITKLPAGFKLAEPLTCAICGVSLTLDKATAGPYDGRGHQAFACVSHFSEVEKLITGWADFMAKERYMHLYHDHDLQELIRRTGGRHARFDS